jgi:hypothetical protein
VVRRRSSWAGCGHNRRRMQEFFALVSIRCPVEVEAFLDGVLAARFMSGWWVACDLLDRRALLYRTSLSSRVSSAAFFLVVPRSFNHLRGNAGPCRGRKRPQVIPQAENGERSWRPRCRRSSCVANAHQRATLYQVTMAAAGSQWSVRMVDPGHSTINLGLKNPGG